MIKLLLAILITILLIAFGYSMFKSDKPINVPGTDTKFSSPADTLEGAKDAVNQSQDVQDRLKQEAQEQLNQ